VGTVYQYFPNKAELVKAVAARHAGRMLELVQRAAMQAATASVPEAVRILCDALVQAHHIDAALNRVMVQQVPQLGLHHREEMERAARALVRGYLAAHVDELAVDDLDTASFVLVALVEGITYATILGADDAPDLDAVREETVAVVLRYLLPPAPGQT
jgi:AcrR family transcriptional regulator